MAKEFLTLLDKCQTQVEVLPECFTHNPHLYEAQHHIYLRLCGGNIPENSVTEGEAGRMIARGEDEKLEEG